MNQLTETELFEEPALRVATGTTEELAKVEPPEVRAELEAAKSAALQTIEDAKPKAEPEPLAEQESNLHQTGFVWRTPEITEKPIDPEPEDIKPVTRPTDLEIIYALSGYFIAPRTTVIKWLREMDFDALERGAT